MSDMLLKELETQARASSPERRASLSEVIHYSEVEAGLGGRFTAAVEEADVACAGHELARPGLGVPNPVGATH